MGKLYEIIAQPLDDFVLELVLLILPYFVKLVMSLISSKSSPCTCNNTFLVGK